MRVDTEMLMLRRVVRGMTGERRSEGCNRIRGLALLGTSLVVATAGCIFKPEYDRPKVIEGGTFRDDKSSERSVEGITWWTLFEDPLLQGLIRKGLENNRDLKVAAARIEEARGILGVTRPDQFPRVDITGGGTRTALSEASRFSGLTYNDYTLAPRLSFEVDLWGRYASATEAQRAQLLSTEYGYGAVTLSLVAGIGTTYVQLQDVDRQIKISERTLANRSDATKVMQERFNGGYVAKIDLNQAQIQEADAAVALIALQRSQRQFENALSVLLGDVPHSIERASPEQDPITVRELPIGVPSALLERRPDVRAVEEEARSAVMQIGVARAQQYPALSLTGFLGLNSMSQTDLFSADARTWSIGGTFLGPLIDLGKSWSRVDAAEARARQSMERYEGVVLQAVREVEDAVVAVRTFADEQRVRGEQVVAAQSAAFLSRRRYDDGVTSYLEVLEQERALFTAELARSNARQRELSAIIQLYAALGGGWDAGGAIRSSHDGH